MSLTHGVQALLAKGVHMPAPATVTVGAEVDLAAISGDDVLVHPGCRILGSQTVISAGARLGEQGPVTLVDCRLGPGVSLAGGYAANAVFLAGAAMGLGHHVREGTLVEEEVVAGHGVGLKQTILLPFVRLGSLINFCDILMAGGRGPQDRSEVGASYIHFNFTPGGDKTTPSMIGDVAAGVTLDAAPIFLGGRGGAVGPISAGYGSVVAAGSLLRGDVEAGQLTAVAAPATRHVAYRAGGYRELPRILGKNLSYLASLRALDAWYRTIREPFFAAQDLGDRVYAGALEMLASARAERVARLVAMMAKVTSSTPLRQAIAEGIGPMCQAVTGTPVAASTSPAPTAQPPAPDELVGVLGAAAAAGTPYLSAMRGLDPALAVAASSWLTAIIEQALDAAYAVVPQARPEQLSGPGVARPG